ncbi:MAG: type III pantothenate kinase [Verrucomicrobiota bacterium]
MRSAEFLLVDVSNSFTKVAFSSRARVGPSQRLPTAQWKAAEIDKILAARNVATVVACSVVPSQDAELERGVDGRNLIWLTARSRLNVRIEYPQPQTIGADRLANAVAVTELYGTPAIVIDFGTAVTFDIVSAEAAYVGGVIAPGLASMTNFLYQHTALLPRISLREPRRAVGKTTREAMLAGAVFGYRGLVREILKQIRRERFTRRHVHVVATGGYASLIARELPEVGVVRENLTLEGLRLVGLMNSQK